MNHVVIMAGGIGSRFWPLSTPEYPKQFIDILGCGRTLIQLTVERFQGICPDANFWVVTNEKYFDIVREQIPTIPADHILAEPVARNTAPCIAWACWSNRNEDPAANVIVTTADSVVINLVNFQRIIENSLYFTEKSEAIVTIGVKPNRPETGYGYVLYMEDLNGSNYQEIQKVSEFKEKPNLETAKKNLEAGNYLWNAGIFVWNISTVINAIERNAHQIAGVIDQIIVGREVKQLFTTCDEISIDYAVMEPESLRGNVYTLPADFE